MELAWEIIEENRYATTDRKKYQLDNHKIEAMRPLSVDDKIKKVVCKAQITVSGSESSKVIDPIAGAVWTKPKPLHDKWDFQYTLQPTVDGKLVAEVYKAGIDAD